MSVAKIIETCGGEHAIVRELELASTWLVRRWITHGIPLKNWPALIRLAEKNKKRLTGQMLWDAVKGIIEDSTQNTQ